VPTPKLPLSLFKGLIVHSTSPKRWVNQLINKVTSLVAGIVNH